MIYRNILIICNKQLFGVMTSIIIISKQPMGNQNCRICYSSITHPPEPSHQGFSPEILEFIQQFRRKSIKNIQHIQQKKLPNQAIFRGSFQNGKKSGYGQYFHNHNAFIGNFQNDVPQGEGILVSSFEDFFLGNFRNGKPHGQGKEKLGKYEFQGKFQNGQKKKGLLKTDTYTYNGSFKGNKFQGRGKIKFKTGEQYEGDFKNGKYHGNGVFRHNDTEEYRGQFKNGIYEGYGKYRWEDGSEYNGGYLGNQRCGYGTFKKDGEEWTGGWEEGKRRERGKYEEEPLVI